MDPSVIFAWIITVLAGLACLGAPAAVIVAAWDAIRPTIERPRKPGPAYDPAGRWWRERSALTAPEQRP